MILWLILFLLVVAISFILAYQSMRDFQEKPESFGLEYGLFLIRNRQSFTPAVLDELHQATSKEGLIFSIERLFKGNQSALVLFGPKEVLRDFAQLDLVELEDYAVVDPGQVQAWEMSVKDPQSFNSNSVETIFNNLPSLEETEQFWWQLALKPHSKDEPFSFAKMREMFGFLFPGNQSYKMAMKKITSGDGEKAFQGQIRAVLLTPNLGRREKLKEALENIEPGKLIKVPRPFTSAQILESYKKRTITPGILAPFALTSRGALQLLQI